MQRAYLMAGKRFLVKDWKELEAALSKYGLATRNDDPFTIIKQLREEMIPRAFYQLQNTYGDWADFDDETGYDVCVGEVVAYAKSAESVALSEIEGILAKVRQDIPDAELLLFSNWV